MCIAIALLFAFLALRTAGSTNIIDTDAARHAMNGVFLHDLITSGHLANPIGYGRAYYAHLPSLSIPYHPPLFPLIEAMFYFLFGISVPTARLAVAAAVAVSGIVLFRLVLATHCSTLLAALATITFLSLPYSIRLGSDVMLEFPALVFMLLALRCVWTIDTDYPMRSALAFALFAGAAVWTKQQTVFLGAVPFVFIVLIRRWRLFVRKEIWISSALFGAAVVSLIALSLPFHGAGVNQAAPVEGRLHVFLRNAEYYVNNYPDAVGPVGVLLLAAFALAVAIGLLRDRRTAFYVSWIFPAVLVLLLIGPYTTRYLFFVYPAMFVLGYSGVTELMGKWTAARAPAAQAAASLVCIMAVVWNVRSPLSSTLFMRGPEEVAGMLAPRAPKRILYCGSTDGSFIFNYRSLREGLETIVIAGAKLPDAVFTPAGMAEFAHHYGVEYIVLERTRFANENRRWRTLLDTAPDSMVVERDVPLSHSDERWSGILRVYRFQNPSPEPRSDLTVRMNMIGGTMDLNLKP